MPGFEYNDKQPIAVKSGDLFRLTEYGKEMSKTDWWKKVVDVEPE